jgi:hypothetical protein
MPPVVPSAYFLSLHTCGSLACDESFIRLPEALALFDQVGAADYKAEGF